jgi:hypothetical protein
MVANGHDRDLHLTTGDWLRLMGILFGHALLVFGSLLFWTNRIVIVETKVTAIERQVDDGLNELRRDIKTILRQTKEPL